MLRHSLNMFLRERKTKFTQDQEQISQAEQYLNSKKFHKRLRNGFETEKNRLYFSLIFVSLLAISNQNRKKKRINNDISSEAKVCRDKRSDWNIERQIQRSNNWYAGSCSQWCHWKGEFAGIYKFDKTISFLLIGSRLSDQWKIKDKNRYFELEGSVIIISLKHGLKQGVLSIVWLDRSFYFFEHV